MLSLPYIVELSKLDAIKSVNALKAEVDALRPLATETEQRIMQKLRLDWNYHSNSIEGNQLDYGETVAFLMHGLTAKGKPLKDHLDIRGHNEAILFLTSLVKDERGISEADIRALHKLILVEPYEVDALTPEGNPTKKWIRLGEYKRESNSVKTRTGETHFYATPEETPARMTDLMAWYQEAKTVAGIHPLVVAALFHHEFTAIHPFDDGNGRMARLLSNLILMQSSFPPVVVKKEDRNSYYSV
ncbi:MAG: Fic family protein, partial [Cytophagaceae bacterium]|nr:Fic family protein [Cytophagaceae bacterium]